MHRKPDQTLATHAAQLRFCEFSTALKCCNFKTIQTIHMPQKPINFGSIGVCAFEFGMEEAKKKRCPFASVGKQTFLLTCLNDWLEKYFWLIDFDGNFWERVSQKIELRRTKRNEKKIRDFNFSQDILEKHEPKNEKWNATLNFGKPKWISTLKGETKMLRKRDAELTKRVFKFYENHYVSNSQNKTLQNSKTFFVKRVLKHFRQNLLAKNTSRANHWNTSSKTHAFPQKQIQKQRKFYFSILAKNLKIRKSILTKC